MKILILALFVSSAASAQNFCNVDNDITEEKVILPYEPEYFFKPIPRQNADDNSTDVSLIMEGSNWVMDMKDPSAMRQIPGPYDGVPSPDGEFLIMPGLYFYDRDDLTRNSDMIYDDSDNGSNALDGVYHSIGVTKNQDNKKTYRVITDELSPSSGSVANLMYKDFDADFRSGNIKFERNSHGSKPLCSNHLDKFFKLPMISKDGGQLAAYDLESGTTKIYEIKMNNGKSECHMTKDLGFAAGKVEFSPDGKKITFAMDSHPTNPGQVNWYATPPLSKNYNIYMVDLESDTMSRISMNNTGNSYYPSFWYDGSIVYLNQDEGEYSVVRARYDNAQSIKLPDAQALNSCEGIGKDFLSLMALGDMWTDICSSSGNRYTATGLAGISLSLDRPKCEEMVRGYWKDQQEKLKSGGNRKIVADNQNVGSDIQEKYYKGFLSLSEQDLINSCPGEAKKVQATISSADNVAIEIDENENPMILCQQCHTAAAAERAFDFSDPASLAPHKAKMRLHVWTGFMPQNTPLSPERRDRILKWIDKNIPGPNTFPEDEY